MTIAIFFILMGFITLGLALACWQLWHRGSASAPRFMDGERPQDRSSLGMESALPYLCIMAADTQTAQ